MWKRTKIELAYVVTVSDDIFTCRIDSVIDEITKRHVELPLSMPCRLSTVDGRRPLIHLFFPEFCEMLDDMKPGDALLYNEVAIMKHHLSKGPRVHVRYCHNTARSYLLTWPSDATLPKVEWVDSPCPTN